MKSNSTPGNQPTRGGIRACPALFLALLLAACAPSEDAPALPETTNLPPVVVEAPSTETVVVDDAALPSGPEPIAEDDPDMLAAQGERMLAQGKLEEARRLYARSLAIYPDAEDVNYNLAIVLARLGRDGEAIEYYQKALEIAPDYAEAHNNLGNLLVKAGRFDDAIRHFEDAILINPDHAPTYNNLGTALGRQKKYFEAIAQFSKAVELKPSYLEARFNLGNAFLSAGMVDDAVREFETTLRIQPDFPPARAQLARIAQARRAAPAP